MDAKLVAERLSAAGIENVEIHPSVIAGSAHDYVYVLLTDDAFEGTHIIVSEAGEWEEHEGILIGAYPHYEEPVIGEHVILAPEAFDEAVETVSALIRRLAMRAV